jgi:hypothetical protein
MSTTRSLRSPVLLGAYACARDFKEAIRTVISADFDENTSVTANSVTFFTEEESVEGMKAIRRGREMRRRRDGGTGKTRAMVLHARCH